MITSQEDHMDENQFSIKELMSNAQEAEKSKNNDVAIKIYVEVLQHEPLQIIAYNRLLKLYGQSKAFKKELAIINKAIKSYENYYRSLQPRHNKSISQLSEKLNKAFGLVNKKGVTTYNPEPIGSWQKRKEIVEKKIK